MIQISNVYKRFVELTKLSDEHRDILMKKRGLTQKTIDELKFRSGNGRSKEVIKTLIGEFGEQKIQEEGLIVADMGKKATQDDIEIEQWVNNNEVIVPYPEGKDGVGYLRSHKFGPPGKIAAIYKPCELMAKGFKDLWLTEGEFKAAAAHQMGFPAIAVPGITSYSKKHFQVLVDYIRSLGVERVHVLFDSEDKGNPKFDCYKENINVRYDTEKYSYIMAYKLQMEGFTTYCCELPASWRKNGKADIDGAVASGKTKKDFDKVIKAGLTPSKYRASWVGEKAEVLSYGIRKHFSFSRIQRNIDGYWRPVDKKTDRGDRKDKSGIWLKRLSNFTVKVLRTYFDEDESVHSVVLTDDAGFTSGETKLDATAIASSVDFQKIISRCGRFIFYGTTDDLKLIMQYEFIHSSNQHVKTSRYVGFDLDYNIWITKNMIIRGNDIVKPDDNGIFWQGLNGYRSKSRTITMGKKRDSNFALGSIIFNDEVNLDPKEWVEHCGKCIGDNNAKLILSWVAANVFMGAMFDAYKLFPLFFLFGKTGAGKSTVLQWISYLVGMGETPPINLKNTTSKGINRAMQFISSLPVFLDEYRNTPQFSAKFDATLRAVYNRQITLKADYREADSIHEVETNSSVCLAGEETPADGALLYRLLVCEIVKGNRDDPENFHREWMNAHATEFSSIILNIIRKNTPKNEIIAAVRKSEREFISSGKIPGNDSRLCINYAILDGIYSHCFNEGKTDENFRKFLIQRASETKDDVTEQGATDTFIQDLLNMYDTKDYFDDHKDKQGYWKVDRAKRCIHFASEPTFVKWEIYKIRTGKGDSFNKSSMKKLLKREPYIVLGNKGQLTTTKRMSDETDKRCFIIDVERIEGDFGKEFRSRFNLKTKQETGDDEVPF